MGKKGKKGPNPNSVRATLMDVKRAKMEGTTQGIKRVWALCLMTLSDKEGYSRDDLMRFWLAVNKLAQAVEEKDVTWGDIYHTLKEELGATVEWIIPDEYK